jgi:signal transduction histidine kinase
MFGASSALGLGSSLMGEYATLIADAALRQRAREADRATRTALAKKVQSELVAEMSQELRAPLEAVIAFSKLIAEGERLHLSSEQVAEYADLIRSAAMRLQAVIDDIVEIDGSKSLESDDAASDAVGSRTV